jgi:hypothetical protein
MTMYQRRIPIYLAVVALFGASAAQSAESNENGFEICKPGSAIRRELAEQPEPGVARAAPAHGSCRNAGSSRQPDEQQEVLAKRTQPKELGFVVCKPGSAIRYRLPANTDISAIRRAGLHGSCRN